MTFVRDCRLALLIVTGGLACAGVPATPETGVTAANRQPVPDTSIFAPLRIAPAVSQTRAANGAPGPKYWQNRADYDLTSTLDTVAGVLHGTMTLRYTNNSPNTLDVIWFQTEQNASRRGTPALPGSAGTPGDFGDVIEQFTQLVGTTPTPVQLEDHATETKATLPSPLKPGQTATIQVNWHFIVPPGSGRMGRQDRLYQIAQWYPRVNVYDDVKGWNIEPYLGQGEFFLEYGDYTMNVTVPANYIVAATGTLQNPADVLTPTQRARLAAAATADSVVRVVTSAELADGTAHLKRDGMVTWKFVAKNVRDAVWCASPEYLWDATSWKGILAHAYYRAPAAGTWHEAADQARMSIQEYSERWFQYPYPQVSVTEGPVTGMEYPMLSMDAAFTDVAQLYDVITHEVGHNWFPMIVGSNERVHTWMDEGFNQFINTFSNARRYPQGGSQTARADQYRAGIEATVTQHSDARTDVPADSVQGQVYGYVGYFKPAGIMEMLRRDVLGPETFDKAMRTYVARWAYKHPTPQDFFRTMDDVSKRDLSWFWREWFYETPGYDQMVDSVTSTNDGSSTRVTALYRNKSRGVLPILVRVTLSDGTTQDMTHSADVWRANNTRYVATYTFTNTKPNTTVTRVELDREHRLVDSDRSNNVWTAKP